MLTTFGGVFRHVNIKLLMTHGNGTGIDVFNIVLT